MQNLPNDILKNIFSFIPASQRIGAASTCKEWHLANESIITLDEKVAKLKAIFFEPNNPLLTFKKVIAIIDKAFANKDQAVEIVVALKQSCPEFYFCTTTYGDLLFSLPKLICYSKKLAKENGYKVILNNLLEAQIFTIDELFLEVNIGCMISDSDMKNPNLCSYMLENINKLMSTETCSEIDEMLAVQIVNMKEMMKDLDNDEDERKRMKSLWEVKVLIAQQAVLLCNKELNALEKINNNNNKIYPVFEWKSGGNPDDNASDDKPDSKRRKLLPGS